jgi:hydrogenase maturation protein HypF
MDAGASGAGRAGLAERLRLTVAGTVQGVGFRPHVHRLATELGLSGLVGNDTGSVHIEVEGPADRLRLFQQRLVDHAPPLARIDTVGVTRLAPNGGSGFTIAASQHVAGPVTNAPPDTAACADCCRELQDPSDRRYRYPFITCTNCGPRFTIITSLPYDRPSTTMAGFPLCAPCDAEYHDPTDRRFHAQPVACPDCGPHIWLETGHGSRTLRRHRPDRRTPSWRRRTACSPTVPSSPSRGSVASTWPVAPTTRRPSRPCAGGSSARASRSP